MNYYELHIGDYAKDAGHLSMLEDGAYRRLLDAYYGRERALPADVRECCKLARASTKPERDAVAYVLREFFELHDDGHHQKRADEEITRFQDKQAKARRSANARWNRDESQAEGNANASPDAMRTHSEGNAPRARPQTPDTRHQAKASTPAGTTANLARDASPTEAGRACALMRQAGCPLQQLNPSHPDLLAALDLGVTGEELADTVREAIAAGKAKPFTWAIATARGRLEESRNPVTRTHGATAHATARPSATDRVLEAIQRGRERDREHDDAIDAEAVRVPR